LYNQIPTEQQPRTTANNHNNRLRKERLIYHIQAVHRRTTTGSAAVHGSPHGQQQPGAVRQAIISEAGFVLLGSRNALNASGLPLSEEPSIHQPQQRLTSQRRFGGPQP
jgi:hypothetical protein